MLVPIPSTYTSPTRSPSALTLCIPCFCSVEFPRDLLAAKIVTRLLELKKKEQEKPQQLPPDVLASASAPPAEGPEHFANSHPMPGPPAPEEAPSAPPMELFDPPPKSAPLPAESQREPGFFKRLFSKRKSSKLSNSSQTPSSSSSAQKMTSSSASTSTSSSSAQQTSSSSTLDASSSAPLSAATSSHKEEASSSSNGLKRSKDEKHKVGAKHAQKASEVVQQVAPHRGTMAQVKASLKFSLMPAAMVPAHFDNVNLPHPLIAHSEIHMPFIISDGNQLSSNFYAWSRTLWFLPGPLRLDMHDFAPKLVPAFVLDADLSVMFKATVTVPKPSHMSTHPKPGSGEASRASSSSQSATIKIPVEGVASIKGYHVVFSSIAKSHANYEMLKLCKPTDILPDRSTDKGFFARMFSGPEPAMKLEEFPEPAGEKVEVDKEWFESWREQCFPSLSSHPTVSSAIREVVRANKLLHVPDGSITSPAILFDVSNITPDITSVSVISMASLHLIPIRYPVFIGSYTCPAAQDGDKPHYFAISGQTGEVHDNAQRPLTATGRGFRSIFAGAFSK